MRKHDPYFYVKTVRCVNAERLPVLMIRATGAPDFEATLWVVTSLRSRGLASATIEQALRSLMVLYHIFRIRKINLTERLSTGCWIDPAECEAILIGSCQELGVLAWEESVSEESTPKKILRKVVSLERFRADMRARKPDIGVDVTTRAIRIGYIRSFLNWRISWEARHSDRDRGSALLKLRDLVDEELKKKTPNFWGRSTFNSRTGIDYDNQAYLKRIIAPDHPDNPWVGNFIRVRNKLIIHVFLELGVRRGELLGLRIRDMKPQAHEVLILRRPDDANDPRLYEPNAKTRDRLLLLPSALYRLIQSYLLLRHDIVHGAHDFLFVANAGAPLSKPGLNRIFSKLSIADNFPKITPHVLRHTFCENLADALYQEGKGDVEILNFLRQQGGWSDTSNTPCRYTKRFVQNRTSKAIFSMQEALMINNVEVNNHE
ncbi:site-specific integrase [Chromobacterium piscinae]|uniref:tyrosine-type recombinase/integrase n=1 Tax=Chromobacterium piscinae TaxID=686831 RepID=UPI001E4E859F|nr:site-specific integrase [Chromobacterium piscinae]MCD4505771.1 site-specific integrase [Chromobacterium piscinae]